MKTTKTNVAPAAPMTAEEKAADNLAMIERDIARMTKTARQTLADSSNKMAQLMATVANSLTGLTPQDDYSAAYNMTQSYWPLRDAAEAAGQLKVLSEIATTIADLKTKDLTPDAILAKLLRVVTSAVLRDTSRTESSSNAYSNAMSADAGNGRGKIYKDVAMMIQCFIDNVA
jgi:hypothetical protein